MTKKTDKSTITTKLVKQEKANAVICITIAKTLVQKHRTDSIKHMGENVKIKGFRPGKAPLNLIETELDRGEITSHTIQHLYPETLKVVFKNHDLEIIGNPQLTKATTPDNANWELELTFPLKPQIITKGYKTAVKAALKAVKTKKDAKVEEVRDEKLKKVLDALNKKIKIDIPQSLIDDEVNHSLGRLLDQLEQIGVTAADYLKSINKTSDQLKEQYESSAREGLSTEFILDKIAQEEKIEAGDKEIQEMIDASGDEEVKKKLDTPQERRYISSIIKRRKTIDYLLNL